MGINQETGKCRKLRASKQSEVIECSSSLGCHNRQFPKMERKLREARWPPLGHEVLADGVLRARGQESHEGMEQFWKGMRKGPSKLRVGRNVAEGPTEV